MGAVMENGMEAPPEIDLPYDLAIPFLGIYPNKM